MPIIKKPRPRRKCLDGVCNPQRTQGLVAKPPQKKEIVLIDMKGPGLFLGAHVTKQGGKSGLTFVDLEIDGRNVINLSYAAAKNWSLLQQNPYGLVLLGATKSIKNFTIGWPSPLRYWKSLKLSVTVREAGVVQIVANVIHGR